MDKAVSEIRIKHWETLVLEAGASGTSKKEWCREHGIPTRQFYYWQKKVRDRTLGQMAVRGADRAMVPAVPVSGQGNQFLELVPPMPETPAASHTAEPYAGIHPGYEAEMVLEVDRFRLLIGGNTSENTLRRVMKVILDA